MELEELDWRTGKPMTMYEAHQPKADLDKLYLQRCEGRGLLGLEDFVLVEVHSLEKYLSTSKEKILKEVSCSRITENNQCRKSKEQVHKARQEKYEGKPLHGQFRKSYRGSKKQKVMELVEGYLKETQTFKTY